MSGKVLVFANHARRPVSDRKAASDLGHRLARNRRIEQRRVTTNDSERNAHHGNRILHDALASAGVRIEGGTGLGSSGPALARRTRLPGGLDWRAAHRGMGEASGT